MNVSIIMMSFTGIDLELLCKACGGQQATPAPQVSDEERIRRAVREELDLDRKERERDDARDWERSHPLGRLICQGDRRCMKNY